MDRESAVPSVEGMPGEKARHYSAVHRQHAAPSTYVYDFVWDITRDASGPFCTDVDGNVLLDFTSHVAAAPLGYNNEKLLDETPPDLPDPAKIAGQDFYVSWGPSPEDAAFPGPTQLLDRLTDATTQYGMDTVFLSNSGAEAVENAMKISYAGRGHRAFTFDGAFHGRTLGALSLNRSKAVHRRGFPEVPGIVSAPYCSCTEECTCGWKTDGPGGNVIADMLHPDRGVVDPAEVAYIILEPIQGEGGYRLPNTEFLEDITAIREEYGIHIIADEIQSGIGRTGEMWAVDHTPLDPDIITSGKALRVGATISRSEVFPEERGRLSSTWGAGDILASLMAVRTLDVIDEYNLLENATRRGRQIRETLTDEAANDVVDVRGRGLMLGIEFETKQLRDAVVDAALKRGLLTLGCGHKTLRLLPPLDVTEREATLGVSLLMAAIQDVTAGR